MTTVTADLRDVASIDDNTRLIFASPIREGSDGAVITARRVPVQPVNGVLAVDLEPGYCEVHISGKKFAIEVPDTDSTDLLGLIAASLAFPPETAQSKVAAAVLAYLDMNPIEWESIAPVDGSGRLLPEVLPDLAMVQFKGNKASQAAMLATSGELGDWVIRTDTSTAWLVTGADPTQLSSWTQLPLPNINWSNLTGRPSVVGAGSTAAAARSAIDAEAPIPGAVRLYVDPENGNNSNSGATWDKAFATIQAALDAAPIGGEIVLAPTGHDCGAGATVDAHKLLTFRGAKPLRRRQHADVSFDNQAFLYSSAATKPAALIKLTNTGGVAFGWKFESFYIDGHSLALGGAGIEAKGVSRAIVEDVVGRFMLGATDTGDDARYVLKSYRDGVSDASWWTFRFCVTYGMRFVHMTGANYLTFPGCSVIGVTNGSYKPAGPAVYIQGTQPNLSGMQLEGWEKGAYLDACRAPIAFGLASEWCTTLVHLKDCWDGMIFVNNGLAGSGESAILDENGINNTIIGTDRVYRTGQAVSDIRISKRGTSPLPLAGGYLGPVFHSHATIPNPGKEILPHLGMFDTAMAASGIVAEYHDGTSWQSWAVDTHPLHLSKDGVSGVTIDATHKRCRFIMGSYAAGPLPSLIFGRVSQLGGGTLGTVTVRTYTDAGRTTIGKEYTSLLGETGISPSQVRGFLCSPEIQNGYYLEVELNLGLTGAQTAVLARLAAWASDCSNSMRAARILSGRVAPEGVVSGQVGEIYIAHGINGSDTTNPGIYKKGSGSGNTGWQRALFAGDIGTAVQAYDADLAALAAQTDPAGKLAGIAAGATQNSTDAALRDRSTHTGSQPSSTISDFPEAAQDAVAALLAGTSGVTLNYDDAANTLTITGPGATSALAEDMRDVIGVALLGAGLINIAVNDGADTITITTTATANDTDANLKDRANHTGTQSADTLTDGTTNKAFLATERTKLAALEMLVVVATATNVFTAASVPSDFTAGKVTYFNTSVADNTDWPIKGVVANVVVNYLNTAAAAYVTQEFYYADKLFRRRATSTSAWGSWYLIAGDGNGLASGESSLRRRDISSQTVSSPNGTVRLTYFTAQKTETINSIRTVSGSTAQAGATLCRMGIYEEDPATGNLTLVGSTASDTTLWNATQTAFALALSAGFTKKAGTRYATAQIVVGSTTSPTLHGQNQLIGSEAAQSPRLAGVLSGQTDLPGSISAGSIVASGNQVYGALVP